MTWRTRVLRDRIQDSSLSTTPREKLNSRTERITDSARAAPTGEDCKDLRTPIIGMRAVLVRVTFIRHSSLIQLKGNSRPFMSRMASLRLGKIAAKAAGLP